MSLSKKKFKEIITASDFDQLIGNTENDWLDCKGQSYPLQHDAGKRELAKDVSSFANVQGGYILIGVKTKSSAIHFGDEIDKIRPFEQGLINITQYYDILKSWVYPEIEKLDIKWVAVKNDASKGILIIEIPQQPLPLKPFLITRSLDGKKQVEILFGYAERKRDSSQPLSIVDLQKALRSGFNYENQLEKKLNSFEAVLKQFTGYKIGIQQQELDKKKIDTRINEALQHENMSQQRALILTAYPKQASELKTIFSTTSESIRKYLEHPPVLRYAGWDLETLDQARIIRGEMIRVANGDRKVMDLYRDGTLIFGVLANGKFLAWGRTEDQPKINSIAVVELVYSFINFYNLVLQDFGKMPNEITVRVDFSNMHLGEIKSSLAPYHSQSPAQMTDSHTKDAPDNNYTILKEFKTDGFNIGVVAFELLKEIYLWFGFEEDKIPYIKTEKGIKTVDSETIAIL